MDHRSSNYFRIDLLHSLRNKHNVNDESQEIKENIRILSICNDFIILKNSRILNLS